MKEAAYLYANGRWTSPNLERSFTSPRNFFAEKIVMVHASLFLTRDKTDETVATDEVVARSGTTLLTPKTVLKCYLSL